MVSSPTISGFDLLLAKLHEEPDLAAARYEELRHRITKIVSWKGCPESRADALADETLDRIANKLAAGEEVLNISAYAAGVVRYVWLEYSRRDITDSVGDELPEVAVDPDNSAFEGEDHRMTCLRKCLGEIAGSDDDRRLITAYYDTEPGVKNKDNRKLLAESFGLTASALKVRACRLRSRLEKCINNCVHNVTNPAKTDTYRKGGMSI